MIRKGLILMLLLSFFLASCVNTNDQAADDQSKKTEPDRSKVTESSAAEQEKLINEHLQQINDRKKELALSDSSKDQPAQKETNEKSESDKSDAEKTTSSNEGHAVKIKTVPDDKKNDSSRSTASPANNRKQETKSDQKSDSGKTTSHGNKTAKKTASVSQPTPLVAQTDLSKKTNQILLVVGQGSHAKITFWEKNKDNWSKKISVNGHVGKYGIGSVHEGSMKTPYGAYSLGFAFGTSNPGTSLPFRKITRNSWWVEDSNHPDYNTWQEGKHFNKPSEHLIDYPVQYKYAVVINYNTGRTPWKGSGFFVHCSNGGYTAGCVSLPTAQMKRLLQILRPGAFILNVNSESQVKSF